MKITLPFLLLTMTLFSGCQKEPESTVSVTPSPTIPETARISSQIEIPTQSGHPEIDISSYTLIAPDPEAVKAEAEAVMAVKKRYPIAMRTKDRSVFNEILTRDFTFRGTKDFFNREEYIADRTSGEITDWSVKYENVVLQFIGAEGLVSYRNVISGKDKTGKPEYTERMTWADIYTKENNQWKLKTVHLIDYKEDVF